MPLFLLFHKAPIISGGGGAGGSGSPIGLLLLITNA